MHVAALLLLGFLAQSSDSTASAEAKAKAQSLLTEGSALYEKGDYADALDKFKQAFATYDSPKLLFNIGQANRDLGRPVEALEAFERFLIGALDAAPETIEDAKKLVVFVAFARKRLGREPVPLNARFVGEIGADERDLIHSIGRHPQRPD